MAAKKYLHAGHRSRMRKRFLREGLGGFADHEVLELLLFYALPRLDVNPMAHALMDKFGSLPQVLDAPEEELCTVRGVGPKTARFLTLIPDVLLQTQDCLLAPARFFLRSPADLAALMARRSAPAVPGDTFVIPLDSHHATLAVYPFPSFDELDVREIALLCLELNGKQVALAQCVQVPNALPTDLFVRRLTNLQFALNTLEVRLADCYRFSPDCAHISSAARTGLLLPL